MVKIKQVSIFKEKSQGEISNQIFLWFFDNQRGGHTSKKILKSLGTFSTKTLKKVPFEGRIEGSHPLCRQQIMIIC